MSLDPDDYPLCKSRNVLILTNEGLRVRWLSILNKLTTNEERAAFDRAADGFTLDLDYMLPAEVERFLATLTPEAVMATTTTKKKAAKKAAKMKAAGANSPTAPLPTMEDLDKKIPAIETAIKRIVEWKAQRLSLKEDVDAELSKLPGLFKKHEIDSYKAHGRSVSIEHGADLVKIKKVKEQ